MSDFYDAYDLQNVADPVSYAVPDQNVVGSDLGTLDSSTSNADPGNYAGMDTLSSAQDSNPTLAQAYGELLNGSAAGAKNDTGMNALSEAAAPGPVSATFNAAKDSQAANAALDAAPAAAPAAGVFGQLMKGLGISGDLSKPGNLEAMMKLLMGAGGIANALTRKGTAQNALSAAQLKQAVQPNGSSFTPSQQAMANNYFNTPIGSFADRSRQYAGSMASPIVAGVNGNGAAKYADGGMVNTGAAIDPTNSQYSDPSQYPYEIAQPTPPVSNNYADGGKVDNGKFVSSGALSLVHGNGSGQEDLVHAKLSPGEYVMDADTVASLGDGNNAHGAKVLDAWREQLRAHKRSADSDSIPPQAKEPSHYLKGGALTAMHNSKGK